MNRANYLGCHQRISRKDACQRRASYFAPPQTHSCVEDLVAAFEIFHADRKGETGVSEAPIAHVCFIAVEWRHMRQAWFATLDRRQPAKFSPLGSERLPSVLSQKVTTSNLRHPENSYQPRWLEQQLGISEPTELMLLEADQDLLPEVRKMDLLLVDRSAGNKRPRGEGLYVFSVPTGLAVKRVKVSLKRGFVVTGPGISEELGPMDIDRLLVGRVIFRGGRI